MKILKRLFNSKDETLANVDVQLIAILCPQNGGSLAAYRIRQEWDVIELDDHPS